MFDLFKFLGLKEDCVNKDSLSSDSQQQEFLNLKKRLENSDFYCGVEIRKTKYDEPVLFYKSSGYESNYDVVMLFLSVVREDGFQRFQINLIFDEDEMKVADIQVLGEENFNKGYGSLLLKEAIEYAKKRGAKRITGDIVSENDEHYARQIAFYTKNGLKILDDKRSFEMLL